MKNAHQLLLAIPALVTLTLSGCKATDTPVDAGTADVGSDVEPAGDGAGGATTVSTRGTSLLGMACGTGAECASGFCVDGVCCDSACSDQCYACSQPGSDGTCAPVAQNEDAFATTPCVGAARCVLDPTGSPSCKLKDNQPCSSNYQCAGGFCRTFFSDADGDGYGVATSAVSICGTATTVPPAGYGVLAGDCCDSDRGANPRVPASSFFAAADACGSFDWNCDSLFTPQTTALCPASGGAPAHVVACGASCYFTLLGASLKLFTQECR